MRHTKKIDQSTRVMDCASRGTKLNSVRMNDPIGTFRRTRSERHQRSTYMNLEIQSVGSTKIGNET